MSVLVHALKKVDADTYEHLNKMFRALSDNLNISSESSKIGDTLVFIWLAVSLVERYSDSLVRDDLRMSFINSAISESHVPVCESEDGASIEEFSLSLYGANEDEYWEDYCSVYGTVEELYDEITECESAITRGLLAGRVAKELNIEKELTELERVNFFFESSEILPALIIL